jgi:predicted amidohydrolase
VVAAERNGRPPREPDHETVRIGIGQLDTVWLNKEANFAKAERLVTAASEQGCRLVLLPEMFATGFVMELARLGEPPDGPTVRFLCDLARRHELTVVGTWVESHGDKGLNMAGIFAPEGELVLRYAKIHPFRYLGEHRFYDSGDSLSVAPAAGFRLCPLICYDLRFPELFRCALEAGATLFAVLANWPDTRIAHWRKLLVARAIENQCYVVGVNRTGAGGGLHFPGASLVVDPMGEIVLDAGEREGLFTCEISPRRVAQVRRDFPFLDDRRPELYRSLNPSFRKGSLRPPA